MTKRSALQFYAAAICFFSAIVVAIGGGSMIYGVVVMSSPDIAIHGAAFEAHQNNRSFRRWHEQQARHFGFPQNYPPPEVLAEMQERGLDLNFQGDTAASLPEDEDELTALREESYAGLLAARRHDAKSGLIHKLITVLVAAALFGGHWRILKRSQADGE